MCVVKIYGACMSCYLSDSKIKSSRKTFEIYYHLSFGREVRRLFSFICGRSAGERDGLPASTSYLHRIGPWRHTHKDLSVSHLPCYVCRKNEMFTSCKMWYILANEFVSPHIAVSVGSSHQCAALNTSLSL